MVYKSGRHLCLCLLCITADRVLRHDVLPGFITTLTFLHAAAAGQSMKRHLLSSYIHTVLSVVLAQFGMNGFARGMAGVI